MGGNFSSRRPVKISSKKRAAVTNIFTEKRHLELVLPTAQREDWNPVEEDPRLVARIQLVVRHATVALGAPMSSYIPVSNL